MPNLILIDAQNESNRIRVMTFAASSGAQLPPYTPGAHLDFVLGDKGERSYSLIDWHYRETVPDSYTIAVQHEAEGQGGSKAMHALEVGDRIEASDPGNDFEMRSGSAPVLLLAGGIGVTPLISMATALTHQGTAFQFHYAARSEGVMGFKNRLSNAFPNQMTFHFDDRQKINLQQVMEDQAPGTQIYICGPKGMIDAARAAASKAGHSEDAVHVELFTAPESQSGDQPFEVEIHDTGQVFTVPVGKTIIDVLEEAGKDLMFDCRRGDCGICRTDVISGTPDHRDVVLSQADRASGKVMQICVSRSKSPRLVLEL